MEIGQKVQLVKNGKIGTIEEVISDFWTKRTLYTIQFTDGSFGLFAAKDFNPIK